MALHGHTIIELCDANTGEKQVVEKDNIVTGAVAEIFKPFGVYTSAAGLFTNSSDMKDYISRLYGGLILYDTALGADADTFFAPATAHVTGCAGYGLSGFGTNPMHGSLNEIESNLDLEHGMAKFVYDFSTAQANGTVASVCLSDKYAGCFAAEQAAGPQTAEWLVSGCDTIGKSLSEPILPQIYYQNGAMGCLYEIDEEKDCSLWAGLMVQGTSVSLTISHHMALLHGVSLFWSRQNNPPPMLDTKTIDLTGQLQGVGVSNCACNFDASSRKLYLVSMKGGKTEANGEDWVFELDPDTGKMTKTVITNQTGIALGTNHTWYRSDIGAAVYGGVLYRRSFAKENGVFRYFAIPLDDPADVKEITTNGNEMTTVGFVREGRIYGMDSRGGTVLNTAENAFYSIPVKTDSSANLRVVPIYGRRVLCATNCGDTTGSAYGGWLGMCPNYLATINDLPAPVVKTADKTMKITYILREGA